MISINNMPDRLECARKIIVIEDDKDINALIAYNLRKQGFFVEQVFDGESARERLKNGDFNIAILDIMLPGADGFDICKEIKKSDYSHKTFVIMVTAKSSPQDKLYAHILGADGYFTKPFSIGLLMNTVNEINALQNKQFLVKDKGIQRWEKS